MTILVWLKRRGVASALATLAAGVRGATPALFVMATGRNWPVLPVVPSGISGVRGVRQRARCAARARLSRSLALVLVGLGLLGLSAATVAGAATGDIFRVAGTSVGVSGDGGPATSAELSSPFGVAVTADGGFLIADSGSQRVRKVSAAGTITTVAGRGTYGFSGDGGPATSAQLKPPYGVAETADGGFLIADTDNQRVRRVIGPPPPAPPPPAPPPAAAPPPAPLPDVALFNLSPSSVNASRSPSPSA